MRKIETVRSYFDRTERYLSVRYYIDTRVQIVEELCGNMKGAHILDVACGDGAISKQLYMRGDNERTLLDISSNMLAIAKRNFASERLADGKAKFILGDVQIV